MSARGVLSVHHRYGRSLSSCHHVSFPTLKLAQIGDKSFEERLSALLSNRIVLDRLRRYAFGIADKLDKLLASPANVALVRALAKRGQQELFRTSGPGIQAESPGHPAKQRAAAFVL